MRSFRPLLEVRHCDAEPEQFFTHAGVRRFVLAFLATALPQLRTKGFETGSSGSPPGQLHNASRPALAMGIPAKKLI